MSQLALQQARLLSAPELLNYSQGPSASFGPPLGESRGRKSVCGKGGRGGMMMSTTEGHRGCEWRRQLVVKRSGVWGEVSPSSAGHLTPQGGNAVTSASSSGRTNSVANSKIASSPDLETNSWMWSRHARLTRFTSVAGDLQTARGPERLLHRSGELLHYSKGGHRFIFKLNINGHIFLVCEIPPTLKTFGFQVSCSCSSSFFSGDVFSQVFFGVKLCWRYIKFTAVVIVNRPRCVSMVQSWLVNILRWGHSPQWLKQLQKKRHWLQALMLYLHLDGCRLDGFQGLLWDGAHHLSLQMWMDLIMNRVLVPLIVQAGRFQKKNPFATITVQAPVIKILLKNSKAEVPQICILERHLRAEINGEIFKVNLKPQFRWGLLVINCTSGSNIVALRCWLLASQIRLASDIIGAFGVRCCVIV